MTVQSPARLTAHPQFKFITDFHWHPIRKDLAIGDDAAEMIRWRLEKTAHRLRFDRTDPRSMMAGGLPAEQKAALRDFAAQTTVLLEKLESLPQLARTVLAAWLLEIEGTSDGTNLSLVNIERRWNRLGTDVGLIVRAAELAGGKGRDRKPANVDVARDRAWTELYDIYSEIVGRRPTANEAPGRGKKAAPPNTPFVRFVRAFTKSIPGEEVVTGFDVRGFLRKKKRGNARASIPGFSALCSP
jgi:hypothetical protein